MKELIPQLHDLLKSTEVANHLLAQQLLKGNPALKTALTEAHFLYQLVETWNQVKVEIALDIAQSEAKAKQLLEQRYLPLLDFLEMQGLNDLLKVGARLGFLERSWGLRLYLEEWEYGQDFEAFVRYLTVPRIRCGRGALSKFPKSVFQLRNLRVLELHGCELTSLPNQWDHLPYLQNLQLRGNQLSQLPESIQSLRALTQLDLAYNQFEEVPTVLQKLPQLNELRLSGSSLKALPEWIGDLKQLEVLILNKSQIDHLPDSFRNLTRLRNLSLWGTPLSERYNFNSSTQPEVIQAFIKRALNNKVV